MKITPAPLSVLVLLWLCGLARAQPEELADPSPKPVIAPIDEPIDGPVDGPIDGPIDEPIDGPIDEPIDAPAAGASTLPASPIMPPDYRAPTQERSGLVGGIALGFGSLGAGNDSNGTINYSLSFGGYLSNSLALLVDIWGGQHRSESFRINNNKQGVAVLYWISENLWAKGAIASASYRSYVDDIMISEFRGAALAGGLGWVLYRRGNWHFDGRLSLSLEGYENARDNVTVTALQVGLHYF